MIQPVSNMRSSISFKKTNNQNIKKEKNNSKLKKYSDSFIKHSTESAPMLLGLTAIWSLLDSSGRNIPVKKSIMNNLTGFFLPVLVFSSAILSIIENRQTNKNKN